MKKKKQQRSNDRSMKSRTLCSAVFFYLHWDEWCWNIWCIGGLRFCFGEILVDRFVDLPEILSSFIPSIPMDWLIGRSNSTLFGTYLFELQKKKDKKTIILQWDSRDYMIVERLNLLLVAEYIYIAYGW